MPKLTINRSDMKICEININSGDTLLQAISDAGVYLDAPCGGEGRCRKCLVYVKTEDLKKISTSQAQVNTISILNSQFSILIACLTYVNSDTTIYLPDETEMKIAGSLNQNMSCSSCECSKKRQFTKLGVAVDIGTTTVVARLVDTTTGKIISVASGANAQRVYGADVISRIKYCSANGHEKLTKLIRVQIAALVRQMLSKIEGSDRLNGSDDISEGAAKIEQIVIAGNTIMQHLAAGYSPVSMGSVPFDTISLFGTTTPVWEELLGLQVEVSPDAEIYYTPAIKAYVGGDITAGILAFETAANFTPTGREVEGHANSCFNFSPGGRKVKSTVLFLDIGTNGEIVLKHDGKYYCCATAAGPAFEGAEIEMGTAAVSGAISHVAWNEEKGEPELTIIGETTPIGICGSGLLDTLAFLVESGKVDETGRLEQGGDNDKFYLTESVYITSEDIRKLQLAKAAIAAGVQTLLHHVGISEVQVDALILAGGFGNYLDKKSAARIGLIPQSLLPVTHSLGNTAIEGATIALFSENAREELENIRERTQYIELSTNKIFNEQFIEQIMF